jgi:hypothetical protein
MRTYSWDGLIIQEVSFIGSFLAGTVLVQCNVFQLPTTFDLGAIASIIWLGWFLGSCFALRAYRCPRCGKRLPMLGFKRGIDILEVLRAYREKNFAQHTMRCKHCNLRVWAKSDEDDSLLESKFTPPLP